MHKAEPDQPLAELFADPMFDRLVALLTREVMRKRTVDEATARGIVLAAIGAPTAIACVWNALRARGGLPLMMLKIRRCVIDSLAADNTIGKEATEPVRSEQPKSR